MAKLIYDNTKNRDVFYAVKMDIVDPFFLIDLGVKKYVFLDHREFGLFQERNKNQNIEVQLLNPLVQEAAKLSLSKDNLQNLAWYLLQKYELLGEIITVPNNFPLLLADFLRSKGVKLVPQIHLYPERASKTPDEAEAIRSSVQKTEKAFALIEKILRESVIKGNSIFYSGAILTSEFLKKEVERLLFEEDMISEEGIIISSGLQTAIPHHPGKGAIKPHEPIVCDIFPRSRATRYFADVTRTFVKGTPTEELRKMYEAVRKAQKEGIEAVAPGKKASDIHKIWVEVLLDAGYDVGDKGFIHNTGHGVGLEVHEEPRLGEKAEYEFVPGNVITIEPGLYYPEIGGIRIEDDILVTKDGFENFTTFPKDKWIIA